MLKVRISVLKISEGTNVIEKTKFVIVFRRRRRKKMTNFLLINLKLFSINNINWVPALPIGAAGKKFRNLTIFMHFQGQNLNFLVKILIFYQKIATSKVQIFTGFLLIFGQKISNQ